LSHPLKPCATALPWKEQPKGGVCYCVLLEGQPGVERLGANGSELEHKTFIKPLSILHTMRILG
jgi:hypothetical protein